MKKKISSNYMFAKAYIDDKVFFNANVREKLLIKKYLLVLKQNEKKIDSMNGMKKVIAQINNVPVTYYILTMHNLLLHNPNKGMELVVKETKRMEKVNESYKGNIRMHTKDEMKSLLDGVASEESINRIMRVYYSDTKKKTK